MKTFWLKNKTNITFGIIGIILFTLFILSFLWPLNKETKPKEIKEEITSEKETMKVIVDIKGEIPHPGVYEMERGQRVIDVIKKAGGLIDSSDTSMINLSQKIKDEMVIIIHSKKEIEEMSKEEPCICNEANDACIEKEDKADALKDNIVIGKNKIDNMTTKISLNKATKEELMTLEGIGDSKALSIIEYREKNGGFKNIEDIKEISGIGDAIYEKIKDKITI